MALLDIALLLAANSQEFEAVAFNPDSALSRQLQDGLLDVSKKSAAIFLLNLELLQAAGNKLNKGKFRTSAANRK